MNPRDCDRRFAGQRLQRHLDPDHQRLSSSSIQRDPRTTGDWGPHPMYTPVPPHSGTVAWREPSHPPQNFPAPGGQPLEEEDDPELARKKRELHKLHEQIIQKKATIAFKAIEIIKKNPSELQDPDDEEFETCNLETLRGRVTQKLQQRSFSFFSKVKLSKLQTKSATLQKDELKQQHHPLKLRVKAIRERRLRDPCVLPPQREKVLDVPPPLNARGVTLPEKEERSNVKGFERFLSVLNKGADINLKNMVPDVPVLPPDHRITSPEKQQESPAIKGTEHSLTVPNKTAAAPNKNTKVPDVPHDQDITSPEGRESTTTKGYERLLGLLSKAAVPILNTMVPDVPPPPPDCIATLPAKQQESAAKKGYERLLSVLNKTAPPNSKTTVCDVPLQPPDRSIISPGKDENAASKGYERLLSVLNKGAAINLKTMIPDVPVNLPGQNDALKMKKEGGTQQGSKNESRASRGSAQESGARQSSPSKQSVCKSKADRRSDHEKSVDKRSDPKSNPIRDFEGKRQDGRASESKKIVDRGLELEGTIKRHTGDPSNTYKLFKQESSTDLGSLINRRSDAKSMVSRSSECNDGAGRVTKWENSFSSSSADNSCIKRIFERESSGKTGSGCESIVDRSSEQKSILKRASSARLSEGESSLNRASEQESSDNRGFERFIKLLNSGVDVTKLSKMIKDDVDDLPKTLGSSLKKAPNSESQKSDSVSLLPGCSGISVVKSKTDPVDKVPSSSEDDEVKKAIKRRILDSSSQSELAFEVKKKKEEEQEIPKMDEKHKQVQNILKTLGLNLDLGELSKLTDRTQERLYGRKNKDEQESESRKEQEGELILPHEKQNRSRSASSSSSCSSSSSKSHSWSPLRRLWLSHNRDAHRRSHSRERSRDAYRRSRSRERSRDACERSHSRERSRDAYRRSRSLERSRDARERSRSCERSRDAHRHSRSYDRSRDARERSWSRERSRDARERSWSRERSRDAQRSSRDRSSDGRRRSRSYDRSRDGRRRSYDRSRDAHDRSRDRSRDGVKQQSRIEASNEVQMPSYRNQQYALPAPYNVPTAYADYSLYQYAQYMNYYNAYKSAVNSNWKFESDESYVPPVSLNPQSHSQQHPVLADMGLPVYPAQSSDVNHQRLASQKWLGMGIKRGKKRRNRKKKKTQKSEDISITKTEKRYPKKKEKRDEETVKDVITVAAEKKGPEAVPPVEKTIVSKTFNYKPSTRRGKDDEQAKLKEKKLRTEEEIKANLREKLLEFNRKAKLITQIPSLNIKPSKDSLDSELL